MPIVGLWKPYCISEIANCFILGFCYVSSYWVLVCLLYLMFVWVIFVYILLYVWFGLVWFISYAIRLMV